METHQFLVEGLVVKRLLGVRGWVTAGQSDQARWDRCPPNPAVVGFWTLGVDGLLPPALNKDGNRDGDIELMLPFSVYKAAMIAVFQSMASQTHNKGKRLAADQTDNVTSLLSHNFQKLGIVNSQYVVTWDPPVVSQRPLNNGGCRWPRRAHAMSFVASTGHTVPTGQIHPRRIIVKSRSSSSQKRFQSGHPL